jgi:hypothetical protein
MEDGERELNAVIREWNSQKARKVLAEIRLETGKVEDAKPVVDGILKENGRDLDGKYLKGRIALAEKRLDDAKGLFGEVVKQDASMARARLYNGLTEIQQGRIEIGRKEVEEAVNSTLQRQVPSRRDSLRRVPHAAEKAARRFWGTVRTRLLLSPITGRR